MSAFLGILLGVFAGVMSGLFGIGGGLVIVPLLVWAGYTQRQAQGTSLAALLAPVALLAVLQYAHRHEVRWTMAITIGAGMIAGALLGGKYAGQISQVTLQRAFGALMILAGARFLFFAHR